MSLGLLLLTFVVSLLSSSSPSLFSCLADAGKVLFQVSAYASLLGSKEIEEQHLRTMDHNMKEPLFTFFRPRSSKTLDYVLYTGVLADMRGLLP